MVAQDFKMSPSIKRANGPSALEGHSCFAASIRSTNGQLVVGDHSMLVSYPMQLLELWPERME